MPIRNHVEARSRDASPPRQCVSDDHSKKREAQPARKSREANKMTAALAEKFGKKPCA